MASSFSKAKDRAEAAGGGLSALESDSAPTMGLASYKHGGKVKRTGPARLHKGERVLNRKQARKYEHKRGRNK